MAPPATTFTAALGALGALATVQRTHAAHASALGALERAFDAEMALLAKDQQALQGDRAAMMRQVEEKLARGETALEEMRAGVERDRAELDDEKARMRAAALPPDDVVKLNVGGVRLETSRTVLTKFEDSMLGRMFGRCDAMLQSDPDDGSIFIDRDGERFRLILDLLRDLDGSHTQRAVRALAEAAQESMMKELDYFGLEMAVFGARLWIEDATFQPGPAMGSTMAFTAGPNLIAGREGCAAVLIDADRVLVVGGADDDNGALNSTKIFHLSTLTVTPGPDLQSARTWCADVALDALRVLVVGGYDGESDMSTTEILSLDTMTFAPGPAMANPRNGCAAVALDEGRVMVAGGESDSERFNTTEILDVRTMAFAPGPSMGSARCFCAAVPVDAQRVLVIGGLDASEASFASTELLDVSTMEFSPGPTIQAGRSGIAAARLDAAGEDARILVLGGALSTTTEVLAVDAQRSALATRHRH